MPTRPPMRCSALDCDELATNRGRCAEHQRKRKSGAHRVIPGDGRNTARWRTESTQYLRTSPRCRVCDGPATVVDHIVELADGGAMWDHANWQPLCSPCHDRKTRQAALKRTQRLTTLRHQDRNTETLASQLWNQLP